MSMLLVIYNFKLSNVIINVNILHKHLKEPLIYYDIFQVTVITFVVRSSYLNQTKWIDFHIPPAQHSHCHYRGSTVTIMKNSLAVQGTSILNIKITSTYLEPPPLLHNSFKVTFTLVNTNWLTVPLDKWQLCHCHFHLQTGSNIAVI